MNFENTFDGFYCSPGTSNFTPVLPQHSYIWSEKECARNNWWQNVMIIFFFPSFQLLSWLLVIQLSDNDASKHKIYIYFFFITFDILNYDDGIFTSSRGFCTLFLFHCQKLWGARAQLEPWSKFVRGSITLLNHLRELFMSDKFRDLATKKQKEVQQK